MSYKKVGGLHFVRIGRFGFSFFLSKRRSASAIGLAAVKRALRREARNASLRTEYVSPYPKFNSYSER